MDELVDSVVGLSSMNTADIFHRAFLSHILSRPCSTYEVLYVRTREYLHGLIEEGVWILPKKVRVNDIYNSSLYVTFSEDFEKRASHGDSSYKSSDYLKGEIQAIGLDVDGEKRLRISETSLLPTTKWICIFAKSGVNTINLIINLVKPHDDSRDIVFMQTLVLRFKVFEHIVGAGACSRNPDSGSGGASAVEASMRGV